MISEEAVAELNEREMIRKEPREASNSPEISKRPGGSRRGIPKNEQSNGSTLHTLSPSLYQLLFVFWRPAEVNIPSTKNLQIVERIVQLTTVLQKHH
jgi:hypothetical protein